MKDLSLLIIPIISALVLGCGNNRDSTIEESGTIESTNIIVSSRVSGEIEKIIRDEGSTVSKGDTILIIDHEFLDIQLKQALAGRDIAKAQLTLLINGAREEDVLQAEEMAKQAETNYTLALADKERFENLYNKQAITKKQLEEITARFEISQSQYNAARENLKKIKNIARPEEIDQARGRYEQSEAAVQLIEKNVRDCYVVSPVSGRIVKKFVELGELVSPLSSIVKISDLSKVELVIYASETDLGKVKLGNLAEISTDTYKEKKYEGKVIYISPEAEFTPKNIQTKDERTKLVFAVKIEIPNPHFELKTGMPADAVIHLN